MKRLSLFVFVSFIILAIIAPTKIQAYSGGSGIEADPYLISTPQDLYDIRNNPSAYYKIINDIDLDVAPYNTGAGWNSIPSFTGTLDGNGYVIKNLYINTPNNTIKALFCRATNAHIMNIGLENVNVRALRTCSGLIGEAVSVTLEKVYVTGNVESTCIDPVEMSKVGLISGFLSSASSVSDSYAIGTTSCKADPHRTGIAFGEVIGAGTIVKNVYVAGSTNGHGGIAGIFQNGTELKNSISMATCSSLRRLSDRDGATFANNYGYVDMFADGIKVSAAVGANGKDITFEEFKSIIDLRSLVGNEAVADGWDFENVWNFNSGSVRPTLKNIGNDAGIPISSKPSEELQPYRKNFRYYIGKNYNGTVKIMLVSSDGKNAPSNTSDILDSKNYFKIGIYYIDKEGNVKIY